MECYKEQMPINDGCKPECQRKCVGEFAENFKVYEVCCREVVKVCPICGFEYEAHIYQICPRCRGYGHHMGYGGYGGYGHHMGYGGYGGYGHHMGYGYRGGNEQKNKQSPSK